MSDDEPAVAARSRLSTRSPVFRMGTVCDDPGVRTGRPAWGVSARDDSAAGRGYEER